MELQLSYFWVLLRNVAYMGKILIPAYKNEGTYLVRGQHDAIIDEALFYRVQDILDGKKIRIEPQGTQKEVENELILRGFLICPICAKIATGSASKGRYKYYWYYHCVNGCSWRVKAPEVNNLFLEEVKKYVPKKGLEELFAISAADYFQDGNKQDLTQKRNLITQITEQNNRITKARELLLNSDIEPEDYRKMKQTAEDNIIRLEAQLAENVGKNSEYSSVSGIISGTVEILKNLYLLYVEADIALKRKIIGSIFPEKMVFENHAFRTTRLNEAIRLIYKINSKLRGYKNEKRTVSRPESLKVPPSESEPNRLLKDLRLLASFDDFASYPIVPLPNQTDLPSSA